VDFIGIDGCPAGWVYVGRGQHVEGGVVSTLEEIRGELEEARVVLIDMPIGFPDPEQPVRQCDRLARRVLGSKRSSVFPVPAREVLKASSYDRARQINKELLGRSLSRQSWNIIPRLAELDEFMQRWNEKINIRESHPEILFWNLNGKKPLKPGKKSREGRELRRNLILQTWPEAEKIEQKLLVNYPRRALTRDDIYDALILALSAELGQNGFHSLPPLPDFDQSGLSREIVWPMNSG